VIQGRPLVVAPTDPAAGAAWITLSADPPCGPWWIVSAILKGSRRGAPCNRFTAADYGFA